METFTKPIVKKFFCLYDEKEKVFKLPEGANVHTTSNVMQAQYFEPQDAVAYARKNQTWTPVKVEYDGNEFSIRELIADDYKDYLFSAFEAGVDLHGCDNYCRYTNDDYPEEWIAAAEKIRKFAKDTFKEIEEAVKENMK